MKTLTLLLSLLFPAPAAFGQEIVEPVKIALLTQGNPAHAQELERLVRAELQKPELRAVVIASYGARYDLHFTVGEIDESVGCRGFVASLTVVDTKNRKNPPIQSMHTGRDLPHLAKHLVEELEKEFFRPPPATETAKAAPVRFGQSVYVVASRVDNAKPDLTVETKAKGEFQKKKKFNLAQSPAGADFVVLLLTEYDSYSGGVLTGSTTTITGVSSSRNYVKSITAIVVPAKDYGERKDDLEKLREAAVWQGTVTSGTWREASTSNIVKLFHEYAAPKN